MQTPFIQAINATREYLNYLEQHYNNVQKAFQMAVEKWSSEEIISNHIFFDQLKEQIKMHDYSKLSSQEFIQYRQHFYPTDYEKDNLILKELYSRFRIAREHHRDINSHHWQSIEHIKEDKKVHYAHMIIDLIAMSFTFNSSAEEYFFIKKDGMRIDHEYEEYVCKLLRLFYSQKNND